MSEETTFGTWLRQQRRILDLTQQELADQIGCARITLRRIEADALKPSKELALILLEKLGIPEPEHPKWILFARGNSQVAPTSRDQDNLSNPKIYLATFLFTDIEDSTKLWEKVPEQMKVALGRHHKILQDAITSNGGTVFQIVGDAFCAAFPTALSAISAAMVAQIELNQEPWDLPFPIRVRMGIHTGEAQPTSTDSPSGEYASNQTLNRVARILNAGHGGQVLVSVATRELAKGPLPPNTELRDMGEHYLRNLIQPEHLFQLNIAGLPSDFSPLNTLGSARHNLPAQLTSFIGREKEQVEIIKLITKHRLVTLTGSGGVGKTRLSLKIGGQVLGDYANGVWLAELASISDPTLLTQTVAKVFGLAIQSDTPILEILLNFLRVKTSLLILDNCEHLLDDCAQLTDTLLKHCPNLKILATSREPLGITGEAIYHMPSLELPDLQQILDHFKDYESVRLFVERAQLAQTDFSLTMEDASFVAQICSHLDGIPLALELAAAKVGSLSTKEIAEQLETSFNLLTGGSRTALPRQQTIRASIEWSWTLLSEEERILMRQLSIFAGGWTLESAQAVCDGDVLGLMDSLVKKSIIALNQVSGSARRYRFHEMIRQYAREKLVEAGEEENIRTRHLAYFVKLAGQAEPELYRANQLYWWEKLSAEFDNIRAALEWAVKSDAKAGLQLMTDSWLFWVARSDRNEANRCLTQLLEGYVEADALRVGALVLHTQMAISVRDLTQANILASQALELVRTLSNKDMEAFCLLNMGGIAGYQSDFGRSIPLLEQSLVLSRELGNIFGQALALGTLGAFATDRERGKTHLMESLKLYRVLGHLSGIAFVLKELANLEVWAGDFLQSAPRLEEARSIFRQLGDHNSEASVLQCYGRLAFAQADYPQARAYYEESIALGEMSGDYFDTQWTHANLAYTALKEGDVAQARRHFEISAQSFREINSPIGVAFAIEGLASLHCNQNQPEYAARLIGWADATREKIGDLRPPGEQADVDKDIAACIAKMGEATFSDAYDEGQKMTLEEAMELALGID